MNGDLFPMSEPGGDSGKPATLLRPLSAGEIEQRAREAADRHYNGTRDRSGDRYLLPLRWEQLGETEQARWRTIVKKGFNVR